jgi:hypothetical protein
MKKIVIFLSPILLLLSFVSCSVLATSEDITTHLVTEEATTDSLTNEVETTDMMTTSFITTESLTETPTTQEVITTEESTTNEVLDLEDSYYQYSINSTQNIKILHLNITDDVKVYNTAGVLIPTDDVLFKSDVYEIKSSYILSHEGYAYLAFYLEFNHQRTLVQITMNNKTIPYIISSTVVKTAGEDNLVFQFELFDGFIRQVSANDMIESDYSIENNLLTIYSEYVASMLMDENNFIINYVLEDEQLVIGFISIEN